MKFWPLWPSKKAERRQFVLDYLGQGGWHFGIEIIVASGGLLKRGTGYIMLGQMEEDGDIEAYSPPVSNNQLRRRMYRLPVKESKCQPN